LNKLQFLLAIFANKKLGNTMIYFSLVALIVFILSQLSILPQVILGLRIDLWIMCILALVAVINYFTIKKVNENYISYLITGLFLLA